MDRNREARRAAAMVASTNGIPRRRHRTTNLGDSPEDDGPGQMNEPDRLRDRGSKRDRDRVSGRSKRRRNADESSEKRVNDDVEDDEEDGGVVRMLPPQQAVTNHRHGHGHSQQQQLLQAFKTEDTTGTGEKVPATAKTQVDFCREESMMKAVIDFMEKATSKIFRHLNRDKKTMAVLQEQCRYLYQNLVEQNLVDRPPTGLFDYVESEGSEDEVIVSPADLFDYVESEGSEDEVLVSPADLFDYVESEGSDDEFIVSSVDNDPAKTSADFRRKKLMMKAKFDFIKKTISKIFRQFDHAKKTRAVLLMQTKYIYQNLVKRNLIPRTDLFDYVESEGSENEVIVSSEEDNE